MASSNSGNRILGNVESTAVGRWDACFAEPIPLPDGGLLASLRDAGSYITKLPKTEHDAREWQTAMHVLIEAADHGGPVSFARLGVSQALHRNDEKAHEPSRKRTHWRRSTRQTSCGS